EIAALPEIEFDADSVAPPLDFHAALTAGEQADKVSLIAEVKKASPSKGLIREDFDPVAIASAYAASGASCISVLTDEHFFQGHLDYLKAVRSAVDIPLLRKDFILAESQVYQARMSGADAVLLIAECLEPKLLKGLHDLIVDLGMTPLVELYEEKNIDAVLDCQPKLVGVNNRDLKTFEVDLMHSIRVKSHFPDTVAFVSESGIFTNEDVQLMQANDVDAILVGESLMRNEDIGAAVRRLLGTV
ncbi:UNVERIFIED_CONTAM: hypothetical protein GTU68_053441, partial [Idotea baltica]|nr:hypothetical protein [Idotea baltica]